MTGNELEFFGRLCRALPRELVLPQVAMSALIEPVSRGKSYQSDFRRISQKRVDYAIFTRDLRLLAIVELDDRTHRAGRDAVRDRMVASAGIRTLRFQSRRKPDEAQIRQAVFPQSRGEPGTAPFAGRRDGSVAPVRKEVLSGAAVVAFQPRPGRAGSRSDNPDMV
jgi:hypothetical protein